MSDSENMVELYRCFSVISADVLLDYGISNYVNDIGYYMDYNDKNSIEAEIADYQLQFHICGGEIRIAYDYKNRLIITATENNTKYNGRKFSS